MVTDQKLEAELWKRLAGPRRVYWVRLLSAMVAEALEDAPVSKELERDPFGLHEFLRSSPEPRARMGRPGALEPDLERQILRDYHRVDQTAREIFKRSRAYRNPAHREMLIKEHFPKEGEKMLERHPLAYRKTPEWLRDAVLSERHRVPESALRRLLKRERTRLETEKRLAEVFGDIILGNLSQEDNHYAAYRVTGSGKRTRIEVYAQKCDRELTEKLKRRGVYAVWFISGGKWCKEVIADR